MMPATSFLFFSSKKSSVLLHWLMHLSRCCFFPVLDASAEDTAKEEEEETARSCDANSDRAGDTQRSQQHSQKREQEETSTLFLSAEANVPRAVATSTANAAAKSAAAAREAAEQAAAETAGTAAETAAGEEAAAANPESAAGQTTAAAEATSAPRSDTVAAGALSLEEGPKAEGEAAETAENAEGVEDAGDEMPQQQFLGDKEGFPETTTDAMGGEKGAISVSEAEAELFKIQHEQKEDSRMQKEHPIADAAADDGTVLEATTRLTLGALSPDSGTQKNASISSAHSSAVCSFFFCIRKTSRGLHL